ncbi:MAG: methyltransferase domain-containing protein [Terracidiphilus sp.]
MNINWKIKSMMFGLIDAFSLDNALYFIQKNITRESRGDLGKNDKNWFVHKEHLSTLTRPNVFEFGAGKILAQNIFLSQYFASQTVVDLFPMIEIDLVDQAARRISENHPSVAYHAITAIQDLEHHYGIRYLTPMDASKTPFADSAFDACISTRTLEHIPRESIIAIFQELRRILRPDGLISAAIDYSDHYANSDPRIGRLNFLQYSAKEFKRYNHKVHYQNRLRHYDFERIFKSLGYKVVKNDTLDYYPRPERISSEFESDEPTLCAQRGVFLLQN